MKELLTLERADLRYNEETNAIELIWKKIHDKETYEKVFTEAVAYIVENKVTGWLSDIREEGVVAPATSKWLQEEMIPKAVAGGLKRIAIVIDKDVFKKFYVNNIESTAGKDIDFMKKFDSMEAANEWLKEVNDREKNAV